VYRLSRLAAFVALVLACGGKAGSKAAGGEAGAAAADTGSKPLIALIRAADWMGSEWAEDAIRVGLLEADLEAGRDYELKISSAQGDLATLPSLIDAAIDAKRTAGRIVNEGIEPPNFPARFRIDRDQLQQRRKPVPPQLQDAVHALVFHRPAAIDQPEVRG